MEPRINDFEKGKKVLGTMAHFGKYLSSSPLEQKLLMLVYMRVSQINHCAMCLDIHSKDLRAEGESEQRLYVLNAWQDAPFYSDKERSALAFAEALTALQAGGISQELFNETRKHFSEQEVIDLTMAVITINSYNRLNAALGAPVGTYQVGQYRSVEV